MSIFIKSGDNGGWRGKRVEGTLTDSKFNDVKKMAHPEFVTSQIYIFRVRFSRGENFPAIWLWKVKLITHALSVVSFFFYTFTLRNQTEMLYLLMRK